MNSGGLFVMHLLTFVTLVSSAPPVFLLDVWRRGDASGALRTSDACRQITVDIGIVCSASFFLVTCLLCWFGHSKAIRSRTLVPGRKIAF